MYTPGNTLNGNIIPVLSTHQSPNGHSIPGEIGTTVLVHTVQYWYIQQFDEQIGDDYSIASHRLIGT